MKKLILTLSIVLTLLTSCKKNEVPEPKPNSLSGTQYNCQLEGKITKKDYTQEYTGYTISYVNSNGVQVFEEQIKTTYYIIVKYGQLQPTEVILSKSDWDKYSVGSNYCLD